MKKTLILAGILTLTAAASISNAKCSCALTPEGRPPMDGKMQGPPPPPPFKMTEEKRAEIHKKMEAKKAEMEKCLQLTAEQKAKIDAIHKNTRIAMKPVMEKIKAKHEELKAIGTSKLSPEVQKTKIDELKSEIDALRAQAMEIHKADKAAFEAILTATQKKKLEKMKQKHEKKFKNHCKRCKGGDRPEPKPGFGPPPPEFQ